MVHLITNKSFLYVCTPEDLNRPDAEFLVSLQTLDDTFVQNVHTRFSYRYNEIRWGHQFRPMFNGNQQHTVRLDLHSLDDTEDVMLN